MRRENVAPRAAGKREKKAIKGREEPELNVRRFWMDNGEVKRRIKC